MHPVTGELGLRVGATALRDFVLVMREHQIDPAAVNIEGLPQILLAHRRAFDMPARAPVAPRAFPARNVFCRRFPQNEICRVLLVGGDFNPRAGDLFVAVAAGKFPVIVPGRHVEQHMAVRLVGVPLRDQIHDHRNHRRNMVCRPRLLVRLDAAQSQRIFVKPFNGLFRQIADGDALLRRPRVDLVVNVSDVPHIGHLAVQVTQQPVQNIEHHQWPGVADVDPVIDRRPADIQADALAIPVQRFELFFPPRRGVVDGQLCHGFPSRAWRAGSSSIINYSVLRDVLGGAETVGHRSSVVQ